MHGKTKSEDYRGRVPGVTWIVKYRLRDSPSTTTTAGVHFCQVRLHVYDYIRGGFRQVPLRMRQVRLHDASSTSTVDPVGVKFLS